MAQPVAAGGQLGLLGLAGLGVLDLGELVDEQVELAVARARALVQPVERRLGLPDARVRRGRLGQPARWASPQKPSSASSWAEASVSLRCSCWP